MEDEYVLKPTQEKDILAILKVIEKYDLYEEVWWRTDPEYAQITFMVNCNDIFWWGCADCEDLTIENLPVLIQSCEDIKNIEKTKYHYSELGPILFCCRIRKMRPQGAYFSYVPKEAWHLFKDAGPRRKIDGGNSWRIGTYKKPEIKHKCSKCGSCEVEKIIV